MNVLVLGALGILLLGHGAIHLWWLAPPSKEAAALTDPASAWPTKWGMDVRIVRALSILLAITVTGLYALAAIGTMGWLISASTWRSMTLAASALSLVLLAAYWTPQGWIGVAIDVLLIVALLLRLPAKVGIPG